MTTDHNLRAIRRPAVGLLMALATVALATGAVAAQETGVEPEALAGPTVGMPQPALEGGQADGDILADLHSEYLREIAGEWSVTDSSTSAAVDPSLLHSEYLREIAADW